MNGYAGLAFRMSENPELQIIRKFEALRIQQLFYLQAELAHLENRVRAKAAADASSGVLERELYARDWYSLCHTNTSEGGSMEQWELWLEIRKKIKEYGQKCQPNQVDRALM